MNKTTCNKKPANIFKQKQEIRGVTCTLVVEGSLAENV